MSDTNTAEADIDSMSDEDFASFKKDMADNTIDTDTHEEKPAPEPKASEQDADEDEDDAPEGGDKQETVPHGRFHRERERRKQLEAEIGENRRKFELLEQRTNAILQMQTQQRQPEPEAKPSFHEEYQRLLDSGDVIAALNLQAAKLNEYETARTQSEQTAEQRNVATRVVNQVVHASRQDLQRAVQEDESVADAYNFMRQEGYRQLVELQGMSHDDALSALNRYEIETFHGVLSKNERPSDFVKKYAALRGWQPPQPEPEAPDLAAAQAEMDKLNNTKRAAKTLSGAGSEARTSLPSPKDLTEMSDEEFAAFKSKYGDGAMAKVAWQ